MSIPQLRPLCAAVALTLLLGACGADTRPVPARAEPSATPSPAVSGTGTPAPSPQEDVLPGAQAYVDAVNAGDLDGLVNAFAEDGEVIDVSRRIRGREAIRTWADNEVIGGELRVERVTTLGPDQQRLRVRWTPEGSDGWAADYTFTTSDDLIRTAELQYAA